MQSLDGKTVIDVVTTMSDDRVLAGVTTLLQQSNGITAEFLAYLGEVDHRQLYTQHATSSTFAFCLERLHLSGSAAYKRIQAARAARRFPLILERIAAGELHLTAVNVLAPYLTQENHRELLDRARHRTKRGMQMLIAEIAPRPDIPSLVRPVAETNPAASVPAGAAPSGAESSGLRVARDASTQPSVVAPLSPGRYEIRITVDQETHDRLVQLQDLLSHKIPDRDPAIVISQSLELHLEQAMTRRAAQTARPRPCRASEKRSRHIPAAVRRQVWRRDRGRCAFVDAQGRRCSSTAFIQFHHVDNWARGADHSPERIELRCHAHNQHHAVLDDGREFVKARRARRSQARRSEDGAERTRPTGRRRGASGQRAATRTEVAREGGKARARTSGREAAPFAGDSVLDERGPVERPKRRVRVRAGPCGTA